MTEQICSCPSEKKEEADATKQTDNKQTDINPTTTPAPTYVLKSEFDKLITDYSNLSKQLEDLKKLETQIGIRKPEPTTTVSNQDTSTLSLAEHADKMIKHIKQYGKYEMTVDYDTLRKLAVQNVATSEGVREVYTSNPNNINKIKEAVTLSGTHAVPDVDPTVALVPGGISWKSVRQYAKYKELPQGSTTAKFFRKNLPGLNTQTAGTTPPESAQTFTAVDVTESTITGVYQPVSTAAIEDVPYDLLSEVVQAAAGLLIDFEATDMLDTVSAQGTLTPGRWIRGDTGLTISNSDIAGVVFDETPLFVAREYLEERGYLRGGVRPVAFIHPKQWRELVTSSEVSKLIQNSAPNLWLSQTVETLAGVEIVVTNTVQHVTAQTNQAYNAIVAVPQHSYGIASKRPVTIKFSERPEDNVIRTNVNWRLKSAVIDPSSIVRISSTA